MSLFTKKSETPETPAEGFAALDTAAPTAEPAATAIDGVSAEAKKTVADMKQKLHVPAAAIDPAVMGYLNSAISVAVTESIKGLMPALLEIGKSSRLSERELKILAGKNPEQEQAFADRLKRERADWQRSEKEKNDNLARTQANCRHLDGNGKENWHVISNYPDRQKRFLCPACSMMVEPRRWSILSPEPITGKERSELLSAHPLYESVLRWASQSGKL